MAALSGVDMRGIGSPLIVVYRPSRSGVRASADCQAASASLTGASESAWCLVPAGIEVVNAGSLSRWGGAHASTYASTDPTARAHQAAGEVPPMHLYGTPNSSYLGLEVPRERALH